MRPSLSGSAALHAMGNAELRYAVRLYREMTDALTVFHRARCPTCSLFLIETRFWTLS